MEGLFSRSTPSVVYISTFIEKTDRLTMNAVEVPAGTGSGFIWDDQGHIVTNFHVIRGANQAKVGVIGPNGDTKLFAATLVGYNPDKDVAVLKINSNGTKLLPLARGSSADLRVGSTALAIGNPFGLDHSLTVGVVSGLGREVRMRGNSKGRLWTKRTASFPQWGKAPSIPCFCRSGNGA